VKTAMILFALVKKTTTRNY